MGKSRSRQLDWAMSISVSLGPVHLTGRPSHSPGHPAVWAGLHSLRESCDGAFIVIVMATLCQQELVVALVRNLADWALKLEVVEVPGLSELALESHWIRHFNNSVLPDVLDNKNPFLLLSLCYGVALLLIFGIFSLQGSQNANELLIITNPAKFII